MAPALGQRQLAAAPSQRPVKEAAPDHVGDDQVSAVAAAPATTRAAGRWLGEAPGFDQHHPTCEGGHSQVKVAVKNIWTMATSPMPSPRSGRNGSAAWRR